MKENFFSYVLDFICNQTLICFDNIDLLILENDVYYYINKEAYLYYSILFTINFNESIF